MSDVGFKEEVARAILDFQVTGSFDLATILVPKLHPFLQSFVGLNRTGEVDTDTLYNMLIPRCGVKDIIGHGAKTRKKR